MTEITVANNWFNPHFQCKHLSWNRLKILLPRLCDDVINVHLPRQSFLHSFTI